MDSEKNKYNYVICGLLSGMLTKTACAPFDRIRLLYQIQPMFNNKLNNENKKYRGILNTAQLILKEEGVVGLWRGNMINTLRGGLCYATKFGVTDITREFLNGVGKEKNSTSVNSLFAGALAGLIQKSLSYPLDVVSVRMALGINTSSLNKECRYRGIFNCISQIYSKEGFSGFFKGFMPTICTGIPYIALQMGFFDYYKRTFKRHLGTVDSDSSFWSTLKNLALVSSISGSLSGFSALLIVFPGDTVRKRMMNNAISNQNRLYKNSIHCFKTIFRNEGILAYYHGLFPSLLKSIPSGAIQFVSYEIFKLVYNIFPHTHQITRVPPSAMGEAEDSSYLTKFLNGLAEIGSMLVSSINQSTICLEKTVYPAKENVVHFYDKLTNNFETLGSHGSSFSQNNDISTFGHIEVDSSSSSITA